MTDFPRVLATTSHRKTMEWNAILAVLAAKTVPTVESLTEKVELLEIQHMDPVVVAITKALDAYHRCDMPVLVEDTAIEIRALKGFPGALYGPCIEKGMGNAALLESFKRNPDRHAVASTTIAFTLDGKTINVLKAELPGVVPDSPRGEGGFGFDSIIIPHGFSKTLAEMTGEEKNEISMRRRAIAMLLRGEWKAYGVAASPLKIYVVN